MTDILGDYPPPFLSPHFQPYECSSAPHVENSVFHGKSTLCKNAELFHVLNFIEFSIYIFFLHFLFVRSFQNRPVTRLETDACPKIEMGKF